MKKINKKCQEPLQKMLDEVQASQGITLIGKLYEAVFPEAWQYGGRAGMLIAIDAAKKLQDIQIHWDEKEHQKIKDTIKSKISEYKSKELDQVDSAYVLGKISGLVEALTLLESLDEI